MKLKINFLWILLFSILGASLAGIIMSLGNIIIEFFRGNSIFTFEDIFPMAVWHLSVWAAAGFFSGFLIGIFRLFRTKLNNPSFSNFFFIYSYFALWILIQGYINIYLFAGLFHFISIIINSLVLAAGTGLLIFLIKKRKKQTSPRPLIWQGVLFSLFGILLLSSFISKQHLSRPSLNLSSPQVQDSTSPSLNVLIVLWDAIRFDHVGCYGYSRNTTPNLDSVAEKGILFENTIAHSSHTKESVPSFFTSLLPSSHNVKFITDALPKNLLTLPQIFKAFGYRTAAISFNPYISPPFGYKRGFNHFLAPSEEFIKINKTVLGHLLELSHRLPLVGELTFSLLKITHTSLLSESSLTSTDAATITDKAIQWIKKDPNKTFFLYLHYEGGHAPYVAPEEFSRLFNSRNDGEPITMHPEVAGLFLPFQEGEPITEEEKKNLVAQYDAKIRYHDHHLGRLHEYLKKSGLFEKTLLVFLSDHGEDFYDHKGWGHGHSLYEEVIHVPLILSSPTYLPQGKRVENLCGLADLFPTILSLCGIWNQVDLPFTIEGKDLTPLIKETSNLESNERYILSELVQGQNFAWALRGERYKLIAVDSGGEEKIMLFDLKQDPFEKKDISQEKPELTDHLSNLMQERIKRAKKISFKPQKMILNEQEKKVLRSLGYID